MKDLKCKDCISYCSGECFEHECECDKENDACEHFMENYHSTYV